MTDLPDLKIKALVSFPAAVYGGTGLAVRQENGKYYFDLAFGELAEITNVPVTVVPTTFVALWESTQDTYRRINLPNLQTQIGGGAPATATPLIESGAGAVGVSLKYAREDHVHPAFGGGGGASVLVSDTPPVGAADNSLWWESDTGNLLIRYNDGNSAQWVAISGGSGGSVDLSTTVRIVGTNNVIGGTSAGAALTTGTQNTVVGPEAGASFTSDVGHTLVGYQAGKALNSAGSTWNTFVGHVAGRFVTTGQSNVALGRASMAYDTDGGYNVAIGHAAYFMGLHSQGVIALGDTAAGADTAGTANWGGTGLTYFGSINDVSCSYIGRNTGKSTASARTNAHAIGTLARIPNRDNVMVLGHGLGAVTTAAALFDGWSRVDITSTASMTITAAQLLQGLTIRSGAITGAVNDLTDTAANLVLNGPGHNAELPCSIEISFGNVTNFTVTLVGGSGVTLSGLGLGGAVASGALAKFRICFTNVTAGSEAVFIYRVG
ncbi:hypothetical protein ABID65_006715 [Bradyrhizobium sp. S3.9.2]|uniref:hypothetical protein n=1 Tax=Bradyrhizobium sp. S3.9.2 TaxID=3156432 RepID=UPI00339AF797